MTRTIKIPPESMLQYPLVNPCICEISLMGDPFLSSACTGRSSASPRIKILHPWVQEFYPVLGLGVWRKVPAAFPDSSSVLDKFESANSSAPKMSHVMT